MSYRSIVPLLVLFIASSAAAQCLDLPNEIWGAPGQIASFEGTLNLGVPGKYTYKINKIGTLTENLQSGLGPTLTNLASQVFSYTVPLKFYIGALIPGTTCSSQGDVVVIQVFNFAGQKVCSRTVAIRCFPAKAVFSMNNFISGSGTAADAYRYCGIANPILANGIGSATQSSYIIDIREAPAGPNVTHTLTAAEAQSLGNFDLRGIVPAGYFRSGKSYDITLRTTPAVASTTKRIAFDASSPAFTMKDRTGKVRTAAKAGLGDASAPITVCPGKMIVDAAATSCETSYLLLVQESDANWKQTNTHAWERWFKGLEAKDGLNLDQLIAAHPDGLKPANVPFTMKGTLTKPRFYRVGLATNDLGSDAKWLLVRTGIVSECAEKITPNDPCPRTKDIPWSDIQPELKRLFESPCVFSTPACPFGDSEREWVPAPTGPKFLKLLVWQGPLPGNSPVVPIVTQDQIVAAMRQFAADHTPAAKCVSGGKVPIAIGVETQIITGPPVQYRVIMNVQYACCEQQ